MKITEFDPVIYPYRLWVAVGTDPNKLIKIFKSTGENPLAYELEDVHKMSAFTIEVADKKTLNIGTIVCFPTKKDITFELVAHEASHFAKNLFFAIGADIRPHEPFEYLVGWVARCCEKVKKGKK